MRSQECVTQVRTCDVRIDRRRRDALMAKQFLDGAQIAATLHEVSREGVAQRMRSQPLRQAKRLGMAADDQKDATACDASATIVDDQRVDVLASAKVRAAAGEIALDSAHGLATAWYDSFATTFTKHANETEFLI